MLLCNTLFNVDTILNELKNPPTASISPLVILERKLKTHYFDTDMDNQQVLAELRKATFDDFPRLKYVLQKVFEGQPRIEIPETLKDWEPNLTFEAINHKYKYFNEDLSSLFRKLAIACRKMTSLIEHQAYDDEMAYKLIALFYNPNKNLDENFQLISQKFNKLISTKRDNTIRTPYHDAFVTILNPFPAHSKHIESWKAFIEKEGFKALAIFAQLAHQPAFANIQKAQNFLLEQTYPRAQEHPTLARLCKDLLISNAGFEAGLKVVQAGWPKKETDNLPILDIPDSSGRCFWVKLPPQDMRALYLGNLIPGCCQHIGGDSERCVLDGIQLSDNGFYVLLKANKSNTHSARIVKDQINGKDYDIVAQSYAWKTVNGNLCLDSIEWNEQRVTIPVIQELMALFSKKVFTQHPDIKHITVGTGGQTPTDIFQPCSIYETMRQGIMYRDAKQQKRIASNIEDIAYEALKNRLNGYSTDFQKTILYLAPYLDNIESIPESLIAINPSIIDTLPRFIQNMALPSSLSMNDFKILTFDEYQQMCEADQSKISTACKILNSHNQQHLMQWLPTIKDEDISLIHLNNREYSPEFVLSVIERLPVTQRLQAIKKTHIEDKSILWFAIKNPELLKIIFKLLPSEQCIEALSEKYNRHITYLQIATTVPELIKIILENVPIEDRLNILKEQNAFSRLSSHPLSFQTVIECLPSDKRLEVLIENRLSNLLDIANHYPEALYKILETLEPIQLLKVLNESDSYGRAFLQTIILKNPELLGMIFKRLTNPQALELIQQKNDTGRFVLWEMFSNPEFLKMILGLFPSEDERLKAVKEKDTYGCSILIDAIPNPETLKMVLDLYPNDEERLEAIKQNDGNDEPHFNNPIIRAMNHPESLKIILELYPISDRLELLKKTNEAEEPILTIIANHHLESFKMILECLTKEQRLEVLKEKNHSGKPILMVIANRHPQLLNMMLEPLNEEQRLEALREKDNTGNTLLHYFLFARSRHYDSLKMALELYPITQRYEAVEEKNNHYSIFNYAVFDPKLLDMIIELLPEEIQWVIKSRAEELQENIDQILECASSIKNFMEKMEGLASPNAIKNFVHAIIQNNDIKSALATLFKIPPSSTMFKPDNRAHIQELINQLHPYWLSRFKPETQEPSRTIK